MYFGEHFLSHRNDFTVKAMWMLDFLLFLVPFELSMPRYIEQMVLVSVK